MRATQLRLHRSPAREYPLSEDRTCSPDFSRDFTVAAQWGNQTPTSTESSFGIIHALFVLTSG